MPLRYVNKIHIIDRLVDELLAESYERIEVWEQQCLALARQEDSLANSLVGSLLVMLEWLVVGLVVVVIAVLSFFGLR